MSRWLQSPSAGLLLLLVLAAGGCRGCDESSTASPSPSSVDASDVVEEPDTSSAADAAVLSAEPTVPIVENPETEATGNESLGHCDVRSTDNRCIDFTGSGWTLEGAQSECANAPGSSFVTETCPSTNRIGTCTIHPNGDASLELIQTFYAPMDPILAEGICPGRFEAE